MLRKLEGVNARYGADGPSSILVYHTRIGLFWASDKDGERYMKDFIGALVSFKLPFCRLRLIGKALSYSLSIPHHAIIPP